MASTSGGGRLLKPEEACEVLRVSKPTLYQLSSRGAIRKVKLGACLRFRLSDLEAFIELNTVEAREPITL